MQVCFYLEQVTVTVVIDLSPGSDRQVYNKEVNGCHDSERSHVHWCVTPTHLLYNIDYFRVTVKSFYILDSCSIEDHYVFWLFKADI